MKKFFATSLLALLICVPTYAQTPVVDKPPLLQGQMPMVDGTSALILLEQGKPAYETGDTVFLTISLKNEGNAPFRIIYDDLDYFYDIEVVGPSGKPLPFLPLHDRRLEGSRQGHTLQPKEAQKAVMYLNRLFDLTEEGIYKVTVSKKFRSGKDVVTVSSKPLLFSVSPPTSIGGWQ